MLEYAWLVPAVPFFSFWLILFFGKRAGDQITQAVGILSLSIAFFMSGVIGYEWIQRAEDAADGATVPVERTTNSDPCEFAGVATSHGAADSHGGDDSHGEADSHGGDEPAADQGAGHGTADHDPTVGHECDLPATGGQSHDDGESGAAGGEPLVEVGDPIDVEGDDHAAGAPTFVSSGSAAQQGPEVSAAGEHGGSGSAGPVIQRWTWFTWGDLEFYIGSHLDGLTAMMFFTVTLVSLLVHVYSTEYLKGDRRFTHYYAFLSLFTASMLFFVSAESLLQMLVGWELVGLCSFALIGHWWEEKKNTDAALKAFLTNRVGDTGLLIGVVVLFFAAGSTTFSTLDINTLAAGGGMSHTLLLVASLCLFAGVTSKSGQFPLHTWLPDAMAGPTPVSALIHAATMVVAGIFLVARMYPVFYEGFSMATSTINYMAFIGGLTTIVGGLLAFAQRDIKKVLAYSTISQLGYMVMALGVGAWTAAVFHVFTHAMFKAALFLGAGSVSHACHHSFDMKADMGGLRKYMPQTYRTFLISSLALAGIFPLAGFWSKDEILAGASNGQGAGGYQIMLVMGLVTAFLTACYMGRCIYLTFFGEYRGHGEPHESPRTITVPLWILTGMAVVAGLFNFPGEIGGWKAPGDLAHRFQTWVEPTVSFAPVQHAEFTIWLAALSTVLAVGGLGAAYLYYWRDAGPHGLTEKNAFARAGYRVLENRFYLDHLYENVIVANVKGSIARAAYWFNQHVLDGIVDGAGRLSTVIGRFTYKYIDQKVVDGAVNGIGVVSDEAGGELRRIQTGRVQQYAALLFGGAVLLAAAFILVV